VLEFDAQFWRREHQYRMEVLRRLLFMTQGCSVRCPQRKRQRRNVIFSPPQDGFAVANLGHRPRNSIIQERSAESAIQDRQDHFSGPLNKRNNTKISFIISCF